MCLGIPGRIVAIGAPVHGVAMGTVSFGGILKEVCLGGVPEARLGEYVIVHAGFAIGKVDPEEAERVFQTLAALAAGAPPAGEGD